MSHLPVLFRWYFSNDHIYFQREVFKVMSFLKELCSTTKVRLIFIAILLWILYTLCTLYDFSTVTWTLSSAEVPFPHRRMNQIYPTSPENYVESSTLSSIVPFISPSIYIEATANMTKAPYVLPSSSPFFRKKDEYEKQGRFHL